MSGYNSYLLGHSVHELKRLSIQSSIIQPITRRLLEAAGVGPGMRVLDVGSGAGDVALLIAEMVGDQGSVIGLEASEIAVQLATKRLADAGCSNVQLHCVRAEAYDDPRPFDVVVGRYVLLFQPDPVAFLRSLKSKTASGSVIAFHEIDDATDFIAKPDVHRLNEINSRVFENFRASLPHHDVASRLYAAFRQAGLPGPQLTCERLAIGGAPNPLAEWLALTYFTMFGTRDLDRSTDSVAQLTREIDCAIGAQDSLVASPEQWCAWAKLA
jgi:protein-L-isoaspartate O-methyltransferase